MNVPLSLNAPILLRAFNSADKSPIAVRPLARQVAEGQSHIDCVVLENEFMKMASLGFFDANWSALAPLWDPRLLDGALKASDLPAKYSMTPASGRYVDELGRLVRVFDIGAIQRVESDSIRYNEQEKSVVRLEAAMRGGDGTRGLELSWNLMRAHSGPGGYLVSLLDLRSEVMIDHEGDQSVQYLVFSAGIALFSDVDAKSPLYTIIDGYLDFRRELTDESNFVLINGDDSHETLRPDNNIIAGARGIYAAHSLIAEAFQGMVTLPNPA